jgi:amidase
MITACSNGLDPMTIFPFSIDALALPANAGPARAIGAAIAGGRVTCVEITQWYLQRIERFNGGDHGLNCVRAVSPLALLAARQADAELAAGRNRGPLHGVPYLVKDNVFTADGLPASAGSRALAEFIPPYEAALVGRLNDAGAILLGKTNMTEFADFVADTMPAEFSGAGGVVRHPLGLRYGRGLGSSVGSAAAVAAGLCAFAIGTETQNSIQAPAVHSAIVGFKPTVGRVSRHGVVPLVPSQDSPGPMTLTVDDAALVFEALRIGAGTAASTLRVGVPRHFMTEGVLTSAQLAAFEAALARLAAAGVALVDPCDMPAAAQLREVRSCVFRAEFKASLNELLAALRPCGMASLADIIAWNEAHPSAIPYGQSLLEAAQGAPDLESAQYLEDRRRDLDLSLERGIGAALAEGKVDVLLSPMATAAKCTGKAGVPVAAIPAGRDADGLPFGVTIYALPDADETVLRAAAVIEAAIGERIAAARY